MRITSAPARIRRSSVCASQDAGPIVATILVVRVRRGAFTILVLLDSAAGRDSAAPAFLGSGIHDTTNCSCPVEQQSNVPSVRTLLYPLGLSLDDTPAGGRCAHLAMRRGRVA